MIKLEFNKHPALSISNYILTTSVNSSMMILTNRVKTSATNLRKQAAPMFSKFLNLNPEKRERIINAAMKEFAQKGFDNASTNEIVKEAEIAKGLLFHYFKNKKQLFLFIYDYGEELSLKEFYQKFNLEEQDFFARIRQMSQLKIEILHKYPEMFRFLEVAYLETSSEVRHDLDQRKEQLLDNNLGRIFEGIDKSRFKADIDVTKAIQIIMWTMEGFRTETLKKTKPSTETPTDYEMLFAEIDVYIELFKQCFYN